MTYRTEPQAHTGDGWAASLRAVVVLSGGVRPNELLAGLGRSLLDLPLPAGRSLLAFWRDQVSAVAKGLPGAGSGDLPLRAIVSRPGALPLEVAMVPGVDVRPEYEKVELRGTGGLLRDIAEEYNDSDALLVAHANQVLVRPLAEVFASLAAVDADIVLLAEPDGSSSGLHLMRCGALKKIRAKGYIDLKEQALVSLAQDCRIRVVKSAQPTVLRVRTLEQYVRTLRALTTGDVLDRPDPYAEEWARTFSLVQDGAFVDPSAIVHDSVVMRGARIGPRAVLVRSLVCEGAGVDAGAPVFDAVIAGPGVRARPTGGAA